MLAIGAVTPSLSALGGGPAVVFYSTAAPPADFAGPGPGPEASASTPEPMAASTAPSDPAPDRLASAATDIPPPRSARVADPGPALSDPIAEAKAAIASCRASYAKVQDYTCTFFKRERIDGRLSSHNAILMKARTRPMSVYLKFLKPTPGREAIYVAGGNGGKALVHDVGIGRLLAGTLKLDPNGSTAMDGCRHPITDAGIGHMIDTILVAWNKELHANESKVVLHATTVRVGDRDCRLIESIHPTKQAGFLFHKVKVYIDLEHDLPIRFEAYDWPRGGHPAELVEEYTYSNLRLNVGLSGRDFDPANAGYSFGRF